MVNEGIIRQSTSPWSSSVWVVPKKMDASGEQKWRVVIDYRKLNECTIDDKYPLPNISDLLDQLGKCQYFTTLDLASGFHQIEIDPKDIPKTAFSVENGHYEFTRMPFGLKNAPSTFQRVMDNILLGILNERCLVYMDDIIVYSPTIHDHIFRLTEVFKRLRNANLKIQPDKCEFLRKEVAYLGHLITQDGVKPNPSKVDCIQRFPEPKTPKDIKSFLGLAGYYRRFIPNFAKLSKPLTRLLQKDVAFNFDPDCRQAFEDLKNALISDPILIYPNFEEPFVLKTVKNRKYFIIPLPFDPETVVQHLFYIVYADQDKFDLSQIYYVENQLELPILEIFSFIFADKEIKIRICQDVIKTPEQDEIPPILDHYHRGKSNLHRGINETIRRIKEKYNWQGLTKDVENFIKNCEICQKVKICRKNLSSPLVITETPKTPFERVNIDLFEYPTRNYALTIRDELTKFTQAYPIEDKTAKSIVNNLIVFFQHYGTPLRIHCDYGREFDNTLMKDLCELYDIKLTFSSVGHPQSNGSIERFHSTLSEMIRANQAENPDEHPFNILPYAVICYNNTKNKTHGFTPYELIFGHTSFRPPEILYNEKALISKYVRDLSNRIQYFYKVARAKTERQKEKAKERFDQHVSSNPPEYKIGDKVYVKESQIKDKSQNKFNGPFEIQEIHIPRTDSSHLPPVYVNPN
ncbi:uncharacterized protein LOC126885399 [Diabrotica virgifera virgifera]|uniref:RNA-directed DNA polymerase n=1 Tax=Diabrotica virgifera virgifera TaxID=50390 RepID=A0ABM5KCK6_DIAVI|nr:uncharacterized protein LOC126885399 [Diabrotica virgifera virgifera]